MHAYDAFSRAPYPPPIPPMRSPHDPVAGSCTPIYDALYSEYRRMFRALPGDRSGEEGFGFHPAPTWQPAYGRHREHRPAALPPGPSAAPDNRMHGR